MKITREKVLSTELSLYEINQYPIQMDGRFNPLPDLDQVVVNRYSSSKVTFSLGDQIFELKGNFGATKITKFTDLLDITSNFTSLTHFQSIEGVKTLRLFIEVTPTDIGTTVDKFIQGFENGDLSSLFAGNDEIHGTDFTNGDGEGAFGTAVSGDLLNGFTGNDKIYAYRGNDEIWGGSGNDQIFGGLGNDALIGGSGNDQIVGGAGKDTIYGGTGRDYFDFDKISDSGITAPERDLIKDFNKSQGDKIDLRTIDAKISTANNDAFSFIGSAPTNNSASQASNGKLWYADGIL
jgi:hypothetical protein